MKLTRWFLILFVLAVVHPQAFGQEQVKPIVISPLIGDTLDAAERDRYHLLLDLKGFHWAIFYLNSDSSLKVRVSLFQNGIQRDTIIERYRPFKTVQNQIRQFAESTTLRNLEALNLRQEAEERSAKVGKGAKVYLRNGHEIEGELVSVRDSSVLIAGTGETVPWAQSTGIKGVVTIKDTMISHVVMKGSSHVLLGMGIGFFGGSIAGAVIVGASVGSSDDRDPLSGFGRAAAAGMGMVIGEVAGTFVGGVIGAGASESDIQMYLSVPAER